MAQRRMQPDPRGFGVSQATMLALAIAGLMGLTGCAPYSYQSEVSSFTRGLDQAVVAFEARYSQEMDKQRLEAFERLAAQGNSVEPVDEDCGDIALSGALSPGKTDDLQDLPDLRAAVAEERERCVLGLKVDPDRASDPAPLLEAHKRLENFPRLLVALRGYSNALTAIVGAGDRAELEDAVVRGQAAIEKFAISIDPRQREGEIAGATSMIAEVFRTAFLAGMDVYQYRALRAAVREANPAVQESARLLTAGMAQFASIDANQAMFQFEKSIADMRLDKPKDSEWLKSYEDLQRKREAYLRTLEISGVFQAMAVAHQDLADQVVSGKGTTKALLTALQNFLDRAQVAYEIYL